MDSSVIQQTNGNTIAKRTLASTTRSYERSKARGPVIITVVPSELRTFREPHT
ncbi:hypothetical protein PHMEG_00028283 [Phytophthora megakarya]|uniref:Uncharacterized protein n=1 Tax=Phytophthora megakarya TaxID=4795 RepID=A0A225V7U7_9STRA|nr:hypothetical protein PHMEG_00028283 [Phytophthora megakarya]